MNIQQSFLYSSIIASSNRIREAVIDEEATAEDSTLEMKRSSDSEREPVSLEGFLLYRMGKSSGQSSFLWKRRFVYFSFADGGSITVYKESPNFNINKIHVDGYDQGSGVLRSVYKKISSFGVTDNNSQGASIVDFDITHDLPWVAKDVERDPASFVVEIPTYLDLQSSNSEVSVTTTSAKSTDSNIDDSSRDEELELDLLDDSGSGEEAYTGEEMMSKNTDEFPDEGDQDFFEHDRHEPLNVVSKHNLSRELGYARSKKKPLRIYFRCEKGSNEKALWLRAFATFGRLSNEYRRYKGLITSLSAPLQLGSTRARIRSKENAVLARDTRNLDLSESHEDLADLEISSVERIALGINVSSAKDKEYRVVPTYAYPHRWMTLSEMRQDMLLPSEHFHDMRVPGCTEKEVGELKVEVLQCLGLPKLDRTADTDAVVYLVCGAYSFITDVIPNRQNPMWLRKSRRACKFPLFHGYASLYVGVFDYEPRKAKDDFAGRIEINLSKLRPGSTYDVILPLRLSAHVYTRRKRGAIRLRFSIKWTTDRDALLSYIPQSFRIPLPQHTTPNFDVTVRSTDPKAFRNIAITVHGAHLPGRFTFVQMRAAIREINFTRKYIFTALRQSFRELRQWQCPSMSAFVFFSWMHCIYVNQFSLVPAYVALFFLINLMCNYVRYNSDEPSQCGFVAPSWEEMFLALVRGNDPEYRAIEPLELVPRKATSLKKRKTSRTRVDKQCQYVAKTHVPMGKGFLRFLGLIPSKPRNPEEEHLEFPFANGLDYPKFTVKECLIHRKKDTDSFGDEHVDDDGMRERSHSQDSQFINNPLSRFSIEMDLPDIMKRDSSGTKEFDEEETNFNAAKVVLAKGKQAKSTLSKTASALGNKTGLSSYIMNPLQSSIDVGVSHVNYISNHMVHSTRNLVSGNNSYGGSSRRAFFQNTTTRMESIRQDGIWADDDGHTLSAPCGNLDADLASHAAVSIDGDEIKEEQTEVDPALVFPQQDIDVEGPQSSKKLTDDLAEVKDKMHELTWHLFDDHTYVIKNSNTVFFGDAKKSEKKRKSDVKKEIDKYLGLQKYSYSNPFVARVGLYVEPIIGSAYSFLCLFRAGFNILTWRDPMMTFWVSFFCGILVLVLFVFPWRIFLFVVGVVLVGPQNWVIRILRQRGHLPPAPVYKSMSNKLIRFTEEINELPSDAPIITAEHRRPGNKPRAPKTIPDDPREIHHVVVPYSPLIYQRCYDWPPEPKYSCVKPDVVTVDRRKLLKKDHPSNSGATRATLSVSTCDPGSPIRQQGFLRNRFNRRRLSTNAENGIVGEIEMPTPIRSRTTTDGSTAKLW